MARLKRPELTAEARRRNREQLARAGADVRGSRRRRRLTQARLGQRVGLSQSSISQIELGLGGSFSLDSWQSIAIALDRPLRLEFGRDSREEPVDAGHLVIQELILRLGRQAGYGRAFELATRPADPSRSADVGLRDDRHRRLLLIEAVNSMGDIGAAVRSSERKRAEAESLGAALGDGEGYAVFCCWVVRATLRNRALVSRYPEVFAARFPGSSSGWIQALTAGTAPPAGRVSCGATSRLPDSSPGVAADGFDRVTSVLDQA